MMEKESGDRVNSVVPMATPDWPGVLNALRGRNDRRLWQEAARRLEREPEARRHAQRQVSLTILATHTADFLASFLPVAALSVGIDLEVRRIPYGQLDTAVLDPAGPLQIDPPDYVLLCGTAEDLQLTHGPADAVVDAAVRRWSGLWQKIRDDIGARVVQCLFVSPADDVYGNAASWSLSSLTSLTTRINSELVRQSEEGGALFVDCERLASEAGRRNWHDPRYWDTVRQPVAMSALPLLARTVAGVLAADLGLTRRCLAVDLDNTLWAGVLGEDGPGGVTVTDAFARFQLYLQSLRQRGMALAVASKNDSALALRALEEVPGMRLTRDDFSVVVADWRPKSAQLREIAQRLGLRPQALAFVDDNRAERAEVVNRLPDVDVVPLPNHPAYFVAALAGRPTLEMGHPAADELARASSYARLPEVEELRVASDSLDTFLSSLRMRAQILPLSSHTLDRAAQLLQKTNQFNLTSHRHTREHLQRLLHQSDWICFTLALRDRFADHGTVGLVLVHASDDVADIDTLLLSCRIIGRTAERKLLAYVGEAARAAGCSVLRGRYIPTGRNSLVADVYPNLGFRSIEVKPEPDGDSLYEYRLADGGPTDTPHILDESV
ncbi:HAD-IIIC family phosphatase [Streptomyces silvisoli]|uniref:HAD-IIIC family phosphatase n=1 Tax=Streptomyces silvisoli TaxID=3034235 RepID=A0ABT5ZKR1_9ACTN|nr:HAD-IIIC family phosphatase [Streptomyces silvisoli]MDF3290276.1 HAD-IIIC family phosphatase [Streptomyces silvisoli]